MAAGAAVIVVAIASLYFWTAATSPPSRNLHLLLAEAFEAGQTELPVDPPAQLLALEDPYDPDQNRPWAINDASLYDGRWYLYFGPAPAALLFLPLHLLGADLSDDRAAPIFASAGFACAAALLLFLVGRYLPRTTTTWRLAAVAALGLGNLTLFLLRRPEVYETSIAAGGFFLMAAILLLVVGALRDRPSPWLLYLGSLAMGLAIGSRANLALATPVLLWAWWRALGPRPGWTRGAMVRTGAAVAGPLALCLAALALYNVVRFGSPTEFGLSYQTGGLNSRELDFFSPGRLLPGAWFYLVQPPSFGLDFPFVTLEPGYPGSLPGDYGVEPVAGMLPVTPLLLGLPVAAAVLWRRRMRLGREPLTLFAVLLAVALAVVLLPVATLPGATERLLVDTSSLLLVMAIVAWLWLADRMRSSAALGRRTLLAVGACSLAYGTVVNLAFGVVGYSDGLRSADPETYFRLERAFSWIPELGATLRGRPLILEVFSYGSLVEMQLVSPSAGTVSVRGDFLTNPALPPGSVVRLEVSGSDGRARRVPLRSSDATIRIPMAARGLQAVTVRFVLAAVDGMPPGPEAPGPGLGLANARVVGWTPR